MHISTTCLILVLAISSFIVIINGQAAFVAIIDKAVGHGDRAHNARLLEHPASGKCMNIERALIGSGIKVILYDCNWRGGLTPVNELFYYSNRHGAFLIQGAASHSNMCLYTGNNYNDPLYTINCEDRDDRQLFEFRKHGHDEYLLIQRSTGRCLRPDGSGNGATIRSVNCDANDRHQKWRSCNGSRRCA